MRRRLDRLFTYARASEKPALENFTTEALACAIEGDAGPLVRALPPEIVGAAPAGEALVRSVRTQVHVPGGIVDLVVELVVDARPLHLWIEVKAHAGLSGQQISAYLDAAERWPSQPKPIVLMLCKHPLTSKVPTLRWNVLRAQSLESCHLYWRELREFLEDHGMADEFDEPLTAEQLGVAVHAQGLLRKAARLAHEFLSFGELPKGWHECEFPAGEAKVTTAMVRQFTRFGRLVVDSGRYPFVCFGLDFRGGPHCSLWIEFKPDDREACDAIFALAGALPEPWGLHRDDPVTPWIGASLPIKGELDQGAALAWLRARVQELEAAKVLAALPRWRRKDRLGVDNESS